MNEDFQSLLRTLPIKKEKKKKKTPQKTNKKKQCQWARDREFKSHLGIFLNIPVLGDSVFHT